MRHGHGLSASRIHSECLYPFREDVPDHDLPPGVAAMIGTGMHSIGQWFLDATLPSLPMHRLAALDLLPDDLRQAEELGLKLCDWLDANGYRERPVLSEFGIVYDARSDTARAGRSREDGYEPMGRWECPATLDIAWEKDGVLYVEDFKSGKPQYFHEEQLAFQALALGRLVAGGTMPQRDGDAGVLRVRTRFVDVKRTKVSPTPWVEYDSDALDVVAGRLYAMLRRLPTAEPLRVVTGLRGGPIQNPQCWFCDQKRAMTCPAWATQDVTST